MSLTQKTLSNQDIIKSFQNRSAKLDEAMRIFASIVAETEKVMKESGNDPLMVEIEKKHVLVITDVALKTNELQNSYKYLSAYFGCKDTINLLTSVNKN
jgi:hypothetical protein